MYNAKILQDKYIKYKTKYIQSKQENIALKQKIVELEEKPNLEKNTYQIGYGYGFE